jgi:integrative and conjugative element protein (TIGR02256 family)
MRNPSAATVWITSQSLQTCIDEATRTFPLESGGTFMGWWTDSNTAVISAIIGPGPKAVHGRHEFAPDQGWQLAQIADHYQTSGRRETYLGDWHSHPNAFSGRLSWTDHRVLRRVIHSPEARCPQPLMAIVWGGAPTWQTAMWRAYVQLRPLLWNRLFVKPADLQIFEGRLE